MKTSTQNYKYVTNLILLISSIVLLTACSPSDPKPSLTQQEQERVLELEREAKLKKERALFEKTHTATFEECFRTGRTNLNNKCLKEINSFLKTSKKVDKKKIIIEVHTDKVGKRSANLRISKKRAYDTAKRLYKTKEKGTTVYYKGFGEEKPLINREDKKANKINRRIKIMLKDKNYKVDTKIFKKFVLNKKKIVSKTSLAVKKTTEVEIEKEKIEEENLEVVKPLKTRVKFRTVAMQNMTTIDSEEKSSIKLTGLQKYTGQADTGWIYFGKKKLKKKFTITCRDDAPIKMKRKSLSHSKEDEFVPSLYNRKISGDYGKNYMELYPIYVFENGYLPKRNPVITLYDESQGIKRYQTTVNTYRGTKGILYRIFVDGKKKINCIDLVISYKTKAVEYGMVYTNEENGGKKFKFLPEK